VLAITVYQKRGLLPNAFRGKVAIPISSLSPGEEIQAWFKLEGKKTENINGELCLKLQYGISEKKKK